MSNYKVSGQVNTSLVELSEARVDEVIRGSSGQNHGRITDGKWDCLENAVRDCRRMHVRDRPSDFTTYNDNGEDEPLEQPLRFLEYRQMPEEIVGDLHRTENDLSDYPAFGSEDDVENYDMHFMYLGVHPENERDLSEYFTDNPAAPSEGEFPPVAELNLNVVSVDVDEDVARFSSISDSLTRR